MLCFLFSLTDSNVHFKLFEGKEKAAFQGSVARLAAGVCPRTRPPLLAVGALRKHSMQWSRVPKWMEEKEYSPLFNIKLRL